MKPTLLITLLVSLAAATSCRGAEDHAADSPPSTEAPGTKASPLEGKWEVFSTGFPTSGPTYFTFRGDSLSIENHFAEEKRIDAPQEVSVMTWKIEIDTTKSPQRLIMRKIGTPETDDTSIVEAFEIRHGELWMRRDFGLESITSESLKPSPSGLVIGLRRIK